MILLPWSLMALGQNESSNEYSYSDEQTYTEEETPAQKNYNQPKEKKNRSAVFTGFSGGMMVNIGYLFTDSPEKVFSNTGLGDASYVKGLPKSGFTVGIGGALRVHLLNHIHVGGEGFVSTMPLMGTGSSVRTGWGDAFCDVYTTWGKVSPMIGLGLGGGAMSRLYVPEQENTILPYNIAADGTYYNASYTKTGFFLLDPYIGMEIALKSHVSLIIKLDYMLPFGKSGSSLTQSIKWSNFMTPTGPRLYVGFMFGILNSKKDKD